jgi:hypothetical protein
VLKWYVSDTIDIGGAARWPDLGGLDSMKIQSESVLALLLLCASGVCGGIADLRERHCGENLEDLGELNATFRCNSFPRRSLYHLYFTYS